MDILPRRASDEPAEDRSEDKVIEPLFSLVLQPRSLLVFKDDLYTHYLHSIAFRDTDLLDDKVINLELAGLQKGIEIKREERLSLTIRVVQKVLKNTLRL